MKMLRRSISRTLREHLWIWGYTLVCVATPLISIGTALAQPPAAEEPPARTDANKPGNAGDSPAKDTAAKDTPAEDTDAENATAEASGALERFKAANQKLNDNLAEIESIVAVFPSADADRQAKLRKQHAELVAHSETVLHEIFVDALAAYEEAPNEDADVTDALIAQLRDQVRNDRYDEASPLVTVMTENACADERLLELAGTVGYCRDDFATAAIYLQRAQNLKLLSKSGDLLLSDIKNAQELWQAEQPLRAAEAEADDLPRVLLKMTKGDMTIELYENEAPQTVGNFVSLVESGFYNGLTFHRVLPGFMAQGGCPDGTGGGGPGYNIRCECHQDGHRKHFRGTLSMAHAGRDTGGSQFFVTFRRTPHLDGQHTVFGRIVEGLDVLAKLQRRDPNSRSPKPQPEKILSASVIRKRNHEYQPTKSP